MISLKWERTWRKRFGKGQVTDIFVFTFYLINWEQVTSRDFKGESTMYVRPFPKDNY